MYVSSMEPPQTPTSSNPLPFKLAKKQRRLLNVDVSAMEGNATFKIPLGWTENPQSSSRSVLPPYIHLSNSQGQPQLRMGLDMQTAKHTAWAAQPQGLINKTLNHNSTVAPLKYKLLFACSMII